MTLQAFKPSRFIIAEPLADTDQVALFHTPRHAVGRLPGATWEAARAGDLTDEATIRHMVDQGFLVPLAAREDIALAHWQHLRTYDLTRLTYVILPNTGQGPAGPARPNGKENGPERMTPTTARQVLAFLLDDIEQKRPAEVRLDFMISDAPLSLEIVRFLAEGLYAFCRGRALAYRVSLAGGLHLKPALIEALKPYGLEHVRLMIGGAFESGAPNGPAQGHGSGCERTIGRLTALAGLSKLHLAGLYDPAQGEHLRLPALLNELLARGLREYLTQVRFAPILPRPATGNETPSLLQAGCLLDPDPERHLWLRRQLVSRGFAAPALLSGFDCPAVRRGVRVIDALGRLVDCPFAPGSADRDTGDVRSGADFQAEALRLVRDLSEECRLRCTVAPLCLGGCRLLADPAGGVHCLKETLEQSIREHLREIGLSADRDEGAF